MGRVDEVWLVHRGALGDGVLAWPVLRWLGSRHDRVVFATDGPKARLAAGELGVVPVDLEQGEFNRLWAAGGGPRPRPGVRLVLDAVGSAAGPGLTFRRGLKAMFPDARVVSTGPFRGGAAARAWAGRHPGSWPVLRGDPSGPIVMHIGAGSESKRWPLDRFIALAGRLRSAGLPAVLLAGGVEAERLARSDRGRAESAGVRWVTELEELAAMVRGGRAFIGNDSGPSHLAAQVGVPTVAIFGPTDPAVWAPVGPAVEVVAPPRPAEIGWLPVAVAEGALHRLLAAAGSRGAVGVPRAASVCPTTMRP